MKNLPFVALVGATNAGKSSLFNRLTGAVRHSTDAAIVAREAGTTRDSVMRTVDDRFMLVDTAGLKDPADDFEATIQQQVDDAISSADLILLVKDATEFASNDDRTLAKKILRSRKPVILILNKIDLKNHQPREEFLRLGIRDIIEVSAEHNQNIAKLRNEIAKNIPPTTTPKSDEKSLKIALIGRPNVGKSQLFNTLCQKQQAVVAPVAGTTRDINRVKVKYKGREIEMLDTAGVRRSGRIEQGIEKFSVLRTVAAIEESDICLLLLDTGELATALDQKLAGLIAESGKGLILVVSKWDLASEEFAAEESLAKLRELFDFTPWAPVIFTSSVSGQNVAKIFEIATNIAAERLREISTRQLNDILQKTVAKHPPAGLKNTFPKMRYIVQTDTAPPWFVIYGSNFKFIHWSYKRFLENSFRENLGFNGTPIKFSFRDEKQMKMNREGNKK